VSFAIAFVEAQHAVPVALATLDRFVGARYIVPSGACFSASQGNSLHAQGPQRIAASRALRRKVTGQQR
jgi:hypothetical protein